MTPRQCLAHFCMQITKSNRNIEHGGGRKNDQVDEW